MLIKLLYIQSTQLSPLQENCHIEMGGIWVLLPVHSTGFFLPRYRDRSAGLENLLKRNLLCTAEASEIPSWVSLEAFGAAKVADEILNKYLSGNWGWRKDSIQKLSAHPHFPFKFFFLFSFF